MSVFSDAELTYLAKGRLGRLATIDGAGMPHVVPLGWRYNPGLDVIDAFHRWLRSRVWPAIRAMCCGTGSSL